MSDSPGNVIEVRDLVAHYDARKVLKGVNLEVRAGEVMVIMGGSGSGKSTLLRQMLGLMAPSSGSIRVLGVDIASAGLQELVDLRRKIGVAFQSGALFSSLSVGDNVMVPLVEHTQLDVTTMQIMMRLKLDFANMAGCEKLMPAQLSGGMIKRAAMARAIVMDPQLLFLDEPSAGLDPVVAASLDELILRLRKASGMSIVVVTHELESAFKIADRIAVLDRGEILICDTVEKVRASDHPRLRALFNREVERLELNPEEYLRRLTGDESLRVEASSR
jgi:phospholipid/cholesterol/gamma-HCH transport system ATP-binding protein